MKDDEQIVKEIDELGQKIDVVPYSFYKAERLRNDKQNKNLTMVTIALSVSLTLIVTVLCFTIIYITSRFVDHISMFDYEAVTVDAQSGGAYYIGGNGTINDTTTEEQTQEQEEKE